MCKVVPIWLILIMACWMITAEAPNHSTRLAQSKQSPGPKPAINIYWLASADGNATGYSVERDGRKIAILPPSAMEFDDSGLAAGTTYTYTVRAQRADTQSEPRRYRERTFAGWPTVSTHAPHAMPMEGYDVVVAQASTGGVAAAIEAARRMV